MCECCVNLKEKKKSFQLFLKTKIEIKAVSSSKSSRVPLGRWCEWSPIPVLNGPATATSDLEIVGIIDQADEKLFQLVLTNPNHVLSSLLPDKTDQHYYLRARSHDNLLTGSSVIVLLIRMLYAIDLCTISCVLTTFNKEDDDDDDDYVRPPTPRSTYCSCNTVHCTLITRLLELVTRASRRGQSRTPLTKDRNLCDNR